jgi:hypothetical protein
VIKWLIVIIAKNNMMEAADFHVKVDVQVLLIIERVTLLRVDINGS